VDYYFIYLVLELLLSYSSLMHVMWDIFGPHADPWLSEAGTKCSFQPFLLSGQDGKKKEPPAHITQNIRRKKTFTD
jgi:hypothetical protein